jgi:hypothetical protein
MSVVNKNGVMHDFCAAVLLMDDALREEIHNAIVPCSDQEFFEAYEDAHQQKFGEEWELSKENPVW